MSLLYIQKYIDTKFLKFFKHNLLNFSKQISKKCWNHQTFIRCKKNTTRIFIKIDMIVILLRVCIYCER